MIVHCVYQLLPSKMKDIPLPSALLPTSSEVMGGTMCSESNHLSPNDFFSLLAYGILRMLKIYTAYCLMNTHACCSPLKGKFSLCANITRMKCYSILSVQAKQWVQLFLSIKEEGHQKKYVTPYMHAMVPNIIRQYGNLKQFSCQDW